jgi:lysophospholipase L1-like esterase
MKKWLIVWLACCWYGQALTQPVNRPFEKEVAAFAHQDSLHPPPRKPILLIGSSSFTKWTDVQQYFLGYEILNRGFGGSSLEDLIYYAPQVLLAYTPRQIIVYCGDNDLAASPQPTTKQVLKRFKQLYNLIRNQWPSVPIIYISIKPSPARWQLESSFVEANERIKGYIQKQKYIRFLDVHTAMLTTAGETRPELYIGDRLHMNAKGYEIWKSLLSPLLLPSSSVENPESPQ